MKHVQWCKIFSRVGWDELVEATRTVRGYADQHGTVSGSTRISDSQLT